jgi:coproporphyrinogen III oxidase
MDDDEPVPAVLSQGSPSVPPPLDLAKLSAEAAAYVRSLQAEICTALQACEAAVGSDVRFHRDAWQRPGGGGGTSAVLQGGRVFEKAGVNISEVHGELDPQLAATMPGDGTTFYATGISLVLHPRNPYVPTTHANFRFLRRGGHAWFGGGADLTPYYPFLEDVEHFHRTFAAACDRHDPTFYDRFKAWCDQYFFLKHRNETRGVGGLFFDYLTDDLPKIAAFWRDCGAAFLPAYLPLVERRHALPFSEHERQFQLMRRGRYVEFNLLYDRGTLFGLKTDGRIESILMSLPPLVRWDYDPRPTPGSKEAALADYLRPRNWLGRSPSPPVP